MGLKLLTLSYNALTGKKVKLHKTGEMAHVSVSYLKRGMVFSLKFEDGRQEPVHWTEDMQGFIAVGDEIEEVDDATTECVALA